MDDLDDAKIKLLIKSCAHRSLTVRATFEIAKFSHRLWGTMMSQKNIDDVEQRFCEFARGDYQDEVDVEERVLILDLFSYIATLIIALQCSAAVPILAVFYMARVKERFPKARGKLDDCARRMILASFTLCLFYHENLDLQTINERLRKAFQFDERELILMQREFFLLIEHRTKICYTSLRKFVFKLFSGVGYHELEIESCVPELSAIEFLFSIPQESFQYDRVPDPVWFI